MLTINRQVIAVAGDFGLLNPLKEEQHFLTPSKWATFPLKGYVTLDLFITNFEK